MCIHKETVSVHQHTGFISRATYFIWVKLSNEIYTLKLSSDVYGVDSSMKFLLRVLLRVSNRTTINSK